MQYDLYISSSYIGGIGAIEDVAPLWVEGHKFSYPYQGEIRDFMVKTLTPTGTTIKVEVKLLPEKPTGP